MDAAFAADADDGGASPPPPTPAPSSTFASLDYLGDASVQDELSAVKCTLSALTAERDAIIYENARLSQQLRQLNAEVSESASGSQILMLKGVVGGLTRALLEAQRDGGGGGVSSSGSDDEAVSHSARGRGARRLSGARRRRATGGGAGGDECGAEARSRCPLCGEMAPAGAVRDVVVAAPHSGDDSSDYDEEAPAMAAVGGGDGVALFDAWIALEGWIELEDAADADLLRLGISGACSLADARARIDRELEASAGTAWRALVKDCAWQFIVRGAPVALRVEGRRTVRETASLQEAGGADLRHVLVIRAKKSAAKKPDSGVVGVPVMMEGEAGALLGTLRVSGAVAKKTLAEMRALMAEQMPRNALPPSFSFLRRACPVSSKQERKMGFADADLPVLVVRVKAATADTRTLFVLALGSDSSSVVGSVKVAPGATLLACRAPVAALIDQRDFVFITTQAGLAVPVGRKQERKRFPEDSVSIRIV